MKKKERLDTLVLESGFARDRRHAEALIRAGEISVNGQIVDKPGTAVAREASLECKEKLPFVSRGGLKLQEALARFEVNPQGRICADIGSSTGGFTDVLLQSGAARVYAIDTAKGELDWKLRSDERVEVFEGQNATVLCSLPSPVSLVVVDVSLLSFQKLFDTFNAVLEGEGEVILLLKPQYEASVEELPPGAIITDGETHRAILMRSFEALEEAGFRLHDFCPSPILGKGGNREFLIHFSPGKSCGKLLKWRDSGVLEKGISVPSKA